jgi:hypothetical protein
MVIEFCTTITGITYEYRYTVMNLGHEISIIAPILRKGDIPRNIDVTGERRRWILFTYDKCLRGRISANCLGHS